MLDVLRGVTRGERAAYAKRKEISYIDIILFLGSKPHRREQNSNEEMTYHIIPPYAKETESGKGDRYLV